MQFLFKLLWFLHRFTRFQCLDVFFFLSGFDSWVDDIYKEPELHSIFFNLRSPPFLLVGVTHLFSFLYCVGWFVLLFVSFLYIVLPILPVSMYCPFLIAPSAFSKVYFLCCFQWICIWYFRCVNFTLFFLCCSLEYKK